MRIMGTAQLPAKKGFLCLKIKFSFSFNISTLKAIIWHQRLFSRSVSFHPVRSLTPIASIDQAGGDGRNLKQSGCYFP